jgi:hypothetical protein
VRAGAIRDIERFQSHCSRWRPTGRALASTISAGGYDTAVHIAADDRIVDPGVGAEQHGYTLAGSSRAKFS